MPTQAAPATCRAMARDAGDGCYALRFELDPGGDTALALPAFEPFVAFELLAQADGQPLAVHQPALDLPLQAITLQLSPGTTRTLHTPIRLCFAPDAPPRDAGFVWTIAHARAGVVLQVRLGLPAPFDGRIPLLFD